VELRDSAHCSPFTAPHFFAPSRLRVPNTHQKIRKPDQNGPFPIKRPPLPCPPSNHPDRPPTRTKTEKTIYTIHDHMLDGHTGAFVAGRVFSHQFRRAVFPTVDRPGHYDRMRFCPWFRNEAMGRVDFFENGRTRFNTELRSNRD
jgi:hypothetical protein